MPAPPEHDAPPRPPGGAPWLLWGPYLSERQWGTVREDTSAEGNAWAAVSHDMARSVAYRWGEEGLAGISDDRQRLCLALALWNGQDPLLKERLFGLTNAEGNHGEDVKEQYWYLDNLPDHRWMRMVYRYPQAAFPYARLLQENARRTRQDPEYELADTGIFADGRYFDVEIACAKADEHDLLLRYTAHNRGDADAPLHLLPTLWFRDDPDLAAGHALPQISASADGRALVAEHPTLGSYTCHFEGGGTLLFTDNATNPARAAALHAQGWPPAPASRGGFKDGINDRVVNGQLQAVHAEPSGTKAAAWFQLQVPAGGCATVRLRLCRTPVTAPFADFDAIMAQRQADADAFYAARQDPSHSAQRRALQRQAWAGLLWNKQFYAYDVSRWLDGDPGRPAPPGARRQGRNATWRHMRAQDIILMPDKWEYPWFAAWDLAFHCIAVAPIDPALAKRQLTLLLHDRYMHPNGQLPAYEWNFCDVNPPVQALAAWKVYQTDAALNGRPDTGFLRHMLHRLMLNFTWWVNREDSGGNNIFEGGFLGLDNVGVFDRGKPLPGGGLLEQADGTSWMAMYALNLMRMAMELAQDDPVYEDLAIKFGEHFFYIAGAMANMGNVEGAGLWDEEDGFYYDLLKMADGRCSRLRLRTIAGLIPLFAVEVLDEARLRKLGRLRHHLQTFLDRRPDLAALVSHWQVANPSAGVATAGQAHAAATRPAAGSLHLFSLLRGHRMKMVLRRMLDEGEFLSPHGIRSVSKAYDDHAFDYTLGSEHYALHYTPAESDTDMFGGNSNWRGPVWMPLNYLIIESLRRFHTYYGDDFLVECPTGSGRMLTISAVADLLRERLLSLFLPGPDAGAAAQTQDGMWWFHEYFHGDTGQGLGASHQTGWTALIATL
ncbi:MGH1-like glycoside hydrolase domain-containing protein [Xylophilus sp. ASV27]|uniref:MGH1-like glycoside hydrolase domain-containing protein n=1 Tax=Xylophilus sp. ASV27 TaxID=2795129 RepID=UPI0018EB23E9|nr:glucosidase [Xylophilus sp. ASV27]